MSAKPSVERHKRDSQSSPPKGVSPTSQPHITPLADDTLRPRRVQYLLQIPSSDSDRPTFLFAVDPPMPLVCVLSGYRAVDKRDLETGKEDPLRGGIVAQYRHTTEATKYVLWTVDLDKGGAIFWAADREGKPLLRGPKPDQQVPVALACHTDLPHTLTAAAQESWTRLNYRVHVNFNPLQGWRTARKLE